jgi:hypothetical protein
MSQQGRVEIEHLGLAVHRTWVEQMHYRMPRSSEHHRIVFNGCISDSSKGLNLSLIRYFFLNSMPYCAVFLSSQLSLTRVRTCTAFGLKRPGREALQPSLVGVSVHLHKRRKTRASDALNLFPPLNVQPLPPRQEAATSTKEAIWKPPFPAPPQQQLPLVKSLAEAHRDKIGGGRNKVGMSFQEESKRIRKGQVKMRNMQQPTAQRATAGSLHLPSQQTGQGNRSSRLRSFSLVAW